MEITNEIKAKVFAQYLGQKIRQELFYASDMTHHSYKEYILSGRVIDLIDTNPSINIGKTIDLLILKPVTSISDEDAIEMAKLFGGVEGKVILNRPKDLSNKDIHFVVQVYTNEPKWSTYSVPKNFYEGSPSFTYQYLQSKGYDLPNFLLGGKTLKESGLAIYES